MLAQVNSKGKTADWLMFSLIFLYGFSVVLPTAARFGLTANTRYIALIVLEILTLSWALPLALSRKGFEIVFLCLYSLFSLHSLLVILLIATKTHVFFGQELYVTTGRPQLHFGSSGALITGLFTNPNALASNLMLLPGITCFFLAKTKTAWQRVLIAASGVLICLHLVLLLSRAACLTAISALSLAVLVYPTRPLFLKNMGIVSFLFASAGVAYFLVNWRFDNSLCLRLFIWRGFLDAVLTNPFGSGWNGINVYLENPHNMLLANLVYYGIFGTLLLCAIILTLLIRANKLCRMNGCALVLFFLLVSMLLIHQSFEYVVTYPFLFLNSLFWLMLGYLQIPPEDESHKNDVRSISPL